MKKYNDENTLLLDCLYPEDSGDEEEVEEEIAYITPKYELQISETGLICPYCKTESAFRREQAPFYEERERECSSCGKFFNFQVGYIAYYHSTAECTLNGMHHVWVKKNGSVRCSACGRFNFAGQNA